ncbi:hypothetical protein [Aurantiacibacter rhizosphaerae]|uniref:Uncharacterized protein n=1 Tax=Aurantiacibacter rhizosphaerae TaxID=2691582 RepID=A0A844XE98_9SPHN|nr:hypothetical protein [Aurantiacibacter rhizosphaerae]MWV27924.1 hypothetical protein [Aurantiacibacter rhizosphaerae]
MNDTNTTGQSATNVEDMLRGELAQGDVILSTARPILRHLLANDDHALFNDEVIAKIRGMMGHLARQLLFKLAEVVAKEAQSEFVDARQDQLATLLLEDTAFLGHAHALSIEAQLADRLNSRSGIDPVLSPLLQELAASKDEMQAAAAMRVVAAQARFMQHQRRMELPLAELPAELFHAATKALKNSQTDYSAEAQSVCDRLRSEYSESDRRVGQITRLVMAMGSTATRALAVDHAGLSVFLTALYMASEQDRDVVVLSLGENQCARLALSLRAAGLGQSAVEEQFLYLHPDITLPEGFDMLRADRAAALLTSAAPGLAG